MLVGRSGLGKTTLLNTLFSTRILDPAPKILDNLKTIEIKEVTNVLEENGIFLKLTIVDTPGVGEQLNNENCWEPIVKYIKDQYSDYLRKELMPSRDKIINDTRIHAILYFIAPTGHALSLIDITIMKRVSSIANLIPVIGKSDSLTVQERIDFKRRIRNELDFHKITYYPYLDYNDAPIMSLKEEERTYINSIRQKIPFAVIGSEHNVLTDNGKVIRGRRTKWGTINIENPNHCEFTILRDFLIRSHLDQLIQWTIIHYENYRERQLIAIRENSIINSKSSTEKHVTTPVYNDTKKSQNQTKSINQPPTPSPAS